MKLMIILTLLVIIVIAGCSLPNMTDKSATATGTVGQVSQDVSNVDEVSKDLDTSDMDNLDKELAGIDW